MFQSGCALEFWSECVLTVVFLINKTLSSVFNGRCPYGIVFGNLHDYNIFRAFGCLCFATNLNVHDKFCARATKFVFLGYADFKKTYEVYDLESGMIFFFFEM